MLVKTPLVVCLFFCKLLFSDWIVFLEPTIKLIQGILDLQNFTFFLTDPCLNVVEQMYKTLC